jgi:glycosyltransferase involved in cell wall biosynthesis
LQELALKIVWFCSSLVQKGGGERFALEAVKALRARGEHALLVCDQISADASFDGRYDLSDVISTEGKYDPRAGYAHRLLAKLLSVPRLAWTLVREKPDLVVCQSEFDAIKLYLISLIVGFRYRTFVFGQMYQIARNIARYSRTFCPHLEVIVASRPGYQVSVKMPPPQLSLPVQIVNEILSWLQRRAQRAADRVFAVSRQGAWEISLVYGKPATIARAAFDETFIDRKRLASPEKLEAPLRFLSLSRLDEKKRIGLMIEAFTRSREPGSLTIIGSGPEEGALRAAAARSHRSADIHFLGAVSDDVVRAEFSRAHCLISLDIGDYDLSVVEAMGKGLRVIVARDFELESFGPGFAGVIAVSPSVGAVAEAIDAACQIPPPSLENLPVLLDQTWQSLAEKVVAP